MAAPTLNRQQLARIYTPRGHKPVFTGQAFIPATAGAYPLGTTVTIAAGSIDLSTPIIGIRLVVKGRITVGTAAFTSVVPQPIQNLLQNIDLFGQHKILGADNHPFSMDGAMWYDILHLHLRRAAKVYISKAGGALTLDGEPGTPYPTSGFDGSTNTFDFVFDLPIWFYPFQLAKGLIPGFQYRSEEWGDSLQLKIVPGGQAQNAAGSLGTAAATTTVTFTAFQSGSGNPTIDIYSLPLIMGAATGLPGLVVPGILVRTTNPRTTQVQSAGTATQILQLQKRKTTRIYMKTGVATNLPVFTSLSDFIVSTVGLQVGTDKFPRNNVDWIGTAIPPTEDGDGVPPIQGVRHFEFLNSGSPFSAYEGDNVTEGATFYLVGNTTTGANQGMLAVQEQMLRTPEGDLYTF